MTTKNSKQSQTNTLADKKDKIEKLKVIQKKTEKNKDMG